MRKRWPRDHPWRAPRGLHVWSRRPGGKRPHRSMGREYDRSACRVVTPVANRLDRCYVVAFW